MDPLYLISVAAIVCAIPLIWWLARRNHSPARPELPAERLDTLAGWPPEPTRILRSSERLAFSTLKLALPGYLILAQVPIARFDRVSRVLKAARINVHVWNEDKLPTIEAARERILPDAPAVPAGMGRKAAPVVTSAVGLAGGAGAMAAAATAEAGGAVVVPGPSADPFADTDRDWSQDEVIEVREPSANTWFDDLDSVSAELPPLAQR